jgi:hypothetical protein
VLLATLAWLAVYLSALLVTLGIHWAPGPGFGHGHGHGHGHPDPSDDVALQRAVVMFRCVQALDLLRVVCLLGVAAWAAVGPVVSRSPGSVVASIATAAMVLVAMNVFVGSLSVPWRVVMFTTDPLFVTPEKLVVVTAAAMCLRGVLTCGATATTVVQHCLQSRKLE